MIMIVIIFIYNTQNNAQYRRKCKRNDQQFSRTQDVKPYKYTYNQKYTTP